MSDPNVYTMGWISAIDLEYAAAQEFFDEEHQAPQWVHGNDCNHYALGRIGKHNVVMAVLPTGENGVAAAATAAKDMGATFPNVRACLMVGIGGGAPSERHDIRLGDVVVSVPSFHNASGNHGGVFQYDYGKTIREKRFCSARYLNKPPKPLLTAVNGLRARYRRKGNGIDAAVKETIHGNPKLRKEYSRPHADTDRLYASRGAETATLVERAQRTDEDDDPAIHYGLIASADNFMEDSEVRDILATELDVLCFEMEAAGLMNNFPCIVIRGICDYSDRHWFKEWRGYAAMTAAAYAKDVLCEVAPTQLEAEKGIGQLLDQLDKGLQGIQITASSTKQGVQSLRASLLDIDQKAVIDRLPVAVEAPFDSYCEESKPRCLPNTRVEILGQIMEWAKNPDAESIFWLNGMAGTGKSTISRSITAALDEAGCLGASFFFNRGEADRSNPSKLFTTIAAQLATKKPAVAPFIKKAIDADYTIGQKGLQEQFDKLIRRPLLAASGDVHAKSTIVLIDALDECESKDKARLIIDLLSREKKLGLRIFITSRPEQPIRLGFCSIEGQYQDMILQDIPRAMIKHDISVFIEHELAKIRTEYNILGPEEGRLPQDWPGLPMTECLVEMAIPLFIFAATVCRFLGDSQLGDVKGQLEEVLHFRIRNPELRPDDMYLLVLNRLLDGMSARRKTKFLDEFRQVVGSIMVLVDPLSAATLSQILSVPQGTVNNQLGMLHSVLSVPQSMQHPVRLLHESFRDFLLDAEKEGDHDFWVDEAQAHWELASHCLRVMAEFLREDVCGMRRLGLEGSIVDRQVVDEHVPAHVQYACLHWVSHVGGAGERMGVCDHDQVDVFLKEHFLHWVESLCLIRRASESIYMMRSLQALLVQDDGAAALRNFAGDAERILKTNLSTIIAAPLQIYSSALVFAPRSSIVANTFEAPAWIRRKPYTERHWDQSVLAMETGGREARSIALSSDSSFIAWIAGGVVEFRRCDTGECFRTFGDESFRVRIMALSPDSSLVALSSGTALQVRHVESGECVGQLEVDGLGGRKTASTVGGRIMASTVVAFSPDLSLLALDTSKAVELLRTDTGECVHQVGFDNRRFRLGAISRDFSLVALVADHGMEIRRTDTGACVHQLQSDLFVFDDVISKWPKREPSDFFVFSPDSLLLLTARGGRLLLWRVHEGTCAAISNLESNPGGYSCASFSRDSSLLASAWGGDTVRLWRTGAAECIRQFQVRGDAVCSLALSHDSSLIALATDGTVRLWRTDDWSVDADRPDSSHGGTVRARVLDISEHSSLMVVVLGDDTMQLWRLDTDECVWKSPGLARDVNLLIVSPDSSRILSTSWVDDGCLLWSVDTGDCVGRLDTRHQRYRVRGVRALNDDWEDGAWEDVAWSHDSSLIVSCDQQAVWLWRADTGQCIWKYPKHATAHYRIISPHKRYISFSHDSSHVAMLGEQQKAEVHVWRVDKGEWVECLHHDSLVPRLSLEHNKLRLRMGLGTFKFAQRRMPTSSVRPDIAVCTGWGLSEDRKWITRNGSNVLRIPVAYRPRCWAVGESTIVLGCGERGFCVLGVADSLGP